MRKALEGFPDHYFQGLKLCYSYVQLEIAFLCAVSKVLRFGESKVKEKTLSELGEFGLISKLMDQTLEKLPIGYVGAGDDCAVIPVAPPGLGFQLVTTDTMVEGRHFRRDFSSAFEVGWKLLAVSLSDVAAMGGVPKYAVIGISLPSDLPVDWVVECYEGVRTLARRFQVHIVGGDTVEAKELSLSLTLFGESLIKPLLRSGASPGDDIWVSGEIGCAGAGLKLLLEPSVAFQEHGDEKFIQAHRKPEPRVELGALLLANGLATSAIDVSDGLFKDLGHILGQSKVFGELHLESVPIPERVSADILGLYASFSAGDDYELLFTSPFELRNRIESLTGEGIPKLTRIGKVIPEVQAVEDEGQRIIAYNSKNESVPLWQIFGKNAKPGFEHFL